MQVGSPRGYSGVHRNNENGFDQGHGEIGVWGDWMWGSGPGLKNWAGGWKDNNEHCFPRRTYFIEYDKEYLHFYQV